MRKSSRRAFLGQAALAGVGATVLHPFAPGELSGQAAHAAEMSDVDPNFVAGRVVDVRSSGEVTVSDLDSQLRELRVDSTSNVWKAARVNEDPLAIDDCVYARGELTDTGLLEVDDVWANIASYQAVVKQASSRQVVLTTDKTGQELPVGIVDASEVETPLGTFVAGDASLLPLGAAVQVVEFNDPRSGDYFASRVLLLDGFEVGAIEDEFIAQGISREGLTTFFCCGNRGGCGRCGRVNSSGGVCGTCRSDRRHCAWVKTERNNCGPFCGNCCVRQGFERLVCGKELLFINPCNSRFVGVQVKDCGPTVRCRSPFTCEQRRKILFDLTPCAFSSIGRLDRGVVSANVRAG